MRHEPDHIPDIINELHALRQEMQTATAAMRKQVRTLVWLTWGWAIFTALLGVVVVLSLVMP